jgi:hypothetical protein
VRALRLELALFPLLPLPPGTAAAGGGGVGVGGSSGSSPCAPSGSSVIWLECLGRFLPQWIRMTAGTMEAMFPSL